MTTYNFGDVVLVPFPFSDQSVIKKRPAIVASSDEYSHRRPDIDYTCNLSMPLRQHRLLCMNGTPAKSLDR